MTRRLRLLCEANPMAYGSSSALLAVLDHVDADVTALVRDVTGELLANDPAVDRALPVDVKNPKAVAVALDALDVDAVLVVSNLANVGLYASRGVPVFFVDVLYWYSANKRHPVWELATRAFVQNFPGVSERVAEEGHARPPSVVGPLIRPVPPAASAPTGALINLGGVRSRFIDEAASEPFLTLVRGTLEAVRADLPPGPVTLAAGRDAVARLARWEMWDVAVAALGQREYLRRLAASEVFLTAPGLNAVFEALADDRPLVFLPPQNATQVLQLARYERVGLVRPGLNLTDLVPGLERVERVGDEATYTRAVLDAIAEVVASPRLRDVVASHVRAQLRTARSPEAAAARRAFRDGLGVAGGPSVARAIHAWWGSR